MNTRNGGCRLALEFLEKEYVLHVNVTYIATRASIDRYSVYTTRYAVYHSKSVILDCTIYHLTGTAEGETENDISNKTRTSQFFNERDSNCIIAHSLRVHK